MPNLTEAQLAERTRYIGGSDAPAVLGVSRFETPYDVFLRKIGQVAPKPSTEEMEAGHFFEETIAQWYAQRTGRELWVAGDTIVLEGVPYVGCHVDRFQCLRLADEDVVSVVEIKFTSKATIHDAYLIQLQHNLLCTGLQHGTIVVQGGTKQIHKDYEADRELHEAMLKIYAAFWKAVEAKNWDMFHHAVKGRTYESV